jgi:hypothetical protein
VSPPHVNQCCKDYTNFKKARAAAKRTRTAMRSTGPKAQVTACGVGDAAINRGKHKTSINDLRNPYIIHKTAVTRPPVVLDIKYRPDILGATYKKSCKRFYSARNPVLHFGQEHLTPPNQPTHIMRHYIRHLLSHLARHAQGDDRVGVIPGPPIHCRRGGSGGGSGNAEHVLPRNLDTDTDYPPFSNTAG